jgi:hypothetical protein
MLGELPKLFGRAFLIGFLLPSAATAAAAAGILRVFDAVEFSMTTAVMAKDSIWAVLLALTVWLGAIALLALNRTIYRFMSGYGSLNPLRVMIRRQRDGFQHLQEEKRRFRSEWDRVESLGQSPSAQMLKAYGDVSWKLARDFPDDETLLLPTKFGNCVRAFEVYPRVVYGVEGTYGWSRLIAVIPADFRQMIEDEKAQMDFWLNIWFCSFLTLGMYGFLAVYERRSPYLWFPLLLIGLAFFSANGARANAQRFGILMTSAFDLYRIELCRKLGFKLPSSAIVERQMWEMISQVWVYRSSNTADDLTKFRETGTEGEVRSSQ